MRERKKYGKYIRVAYRIDLNKSRNGGFETLCLEPTTHLSIHESEKDIHLAVVMLLILFQLLLLLLLELIIIIKGCRSRNGGVKNESHGDDCGYKHST